MSLLQGMALGGRIARNRVLFGPHETNLAVARGISDAAIAYYRRRAVGGAGTIVLEAASVHPSDWPYERCPSLEAVVPGWRAAGEALHAEGALALAGLDHSGGQGSSAYSQSALWAPSGVPNVATREVPKVMEAEDIAAVIDGFRRGAAVARDAGLDGVEINAGQHSLVRQFLSPLTNHRADGYADRLRFAREIVGAVRQGFPNGILGLRLCCDERLSWGGIQPAEGAANAAALAADVDYIVATTGGLYTTQFPRPDLHEPEGFALELARQVRNAVAGRAVVIAQGSIVDVGMADEAIRSCACDAVEMTRAQIADPDLVRKLAAGGPERIRPCILCNQSCQARDIRNPIVSCVGEPDSGHETEVAAQRPQLRRDVPVTIVGGGPAGLECARVAAQAGHRVRVFERRARLGGMVRVAAEGAGRSRLTRLVDWLEAECRRAGVEFVLDCEGPSSSAEPIVRCTGGRPDQPRYRIGEGAIVLRAEMVLEMLGDGRTLDVPAGAVALWDPIGRSTAVSLAERLSGLRPVVLITPDLIVGNLLAGTGDLAGVNARLEQAGTRLLKRSILRRVEQGVVAIEDRFDGRETVIEAVALIDCGYRAPLDDADDGASVRVGDAVAPRSIYEAILEGRAAALALSAA
jgi:mycofactocin system FadH/OYE family oxidoreductase 1